jgi:hypothetical protein
MADDVVADGFQTDCYQKFICLVAWLFGFY